MDRFATRGENELPVVYSRSILQALLAELLSYLKALILMTTMNFKQHHLYVARAYQL